ncbi:hypothetical protein ACG92U_09665 [Leuconostoc citreum]
MNLTILAIILGIVIIAYLAIFAMQRTTIKKSMFSNSEKNS